MPAVGQDGMLAPAIVDCDSEPGCDSIDANTVRVGRVRGEGGYADRPGIEIGMPDEPRLRSREVGMLRESAAPRAWRRRSRASPCWRGCTSRHSRDRGATIPTSTPHDRCRARHHRAPGRASRTPDRGIHARSRAVPSPARRGAPILAGKARETARRAAAAVRRQAGFVLQRIMICQFHDITRRVTA